MRRWVCVIAATVIAVTTVTGCKDNTNDKGPRPLSTAPGGSLIDSVNGVGSTTSREITVPYGWFARYSYTCGDSSEPFEVIVYDTDRHSMIRGADISHASASAADGSFTVRSPATHITFKVIVSSACDWTIDVQSVVNT